MLKYRTLEERVHANAPGRSVNGAPYRPSGGEAAAAGALVDLRRDDWFAPSPRNLLAAFLKGVPVREVLTQLHRLQPPATVPASPTLRQTSASPSALDARWNLVPPGASAALRMSVAAGVALAIQARERGNIVVAFCEDSTRRSWIDALTIAAFHCLPLVVVALGGSPPRLPKTAPHKTRASKTLLVPDAHFCGVPLIPVDAADVVAIYRVAYESIHKARHGGGPTLIEAQRFHLPLPGVPLRPGRRQPDAITRMEEYLTAKGIFDPRLKQRTISRFTSEIDAALGA